MHALRLTNTIMVTMMVLEMEISAWPRLRTAGDALARIRIVFLETVGIIGNCKNLSLCEKERQDLC